MRAERIFLLLTITGIVLPLYFFISGMNNVDWNLQTATNDLFNFITSIFGIVVITWLTVSGTALSVFAIQEAMVRRDYYLLWALPVTLFFSIGAGLPFYLYLRAPKRDQ